ncbi:homeobox-leucine zipper protein HAT14-like [Tasmannia lanceolata]|uniref:homeobox-leucine zipper protein HAT14-like n=1 Tax=Tasmannia lanceolata TaxID=3420 RepID=UPI00406430E7
MELGLSLGEAPKHLSLVEKASKPSNELGLFMGLGFGMNIRDEEKQEGDMVPVNREEQTEEMVSVDHSLQLDLLPLVPVARYSPSKLGFRCPDENGNSERGFDVNLLPSAEEIDEDVSSPNSTVSSFQMDFSLYRGESKNEEGMERVYSRASDEEENVLTRKKLRLSKEQSAFLEESFKEHNTLNPKQKLALAKQLNLRPRQVEVWFQNRRARTKLKQTEVDCEYLKRCCETLTEENRRLQKEIHELRALKTSHPYYMQLPATTLTMCPSCERVATTTTDNTNKTLGFTALTKPRFYPFAHPHQSAAS